MLRARHCAPAPGQPVLRFFERILRLVAIGDDRTFGSFRQPRRRWMLSD